MISCKEFEDLLPEWVAGRLNGEQAAQMEQHRAACPTCVDAEAAESDLRARWRVLQTVQNTPDIRPRLAARLAEAAAASRALFMRRVAFVGSAFATAALCALMLSHTMRGPKEEIVNEARVVNLVTEMQQLPFPEEDRMLSILYRQEERLILVGNRTR
ncbi:MAG TPA: zf-HC2 domain-containing protein [Chthonomonadales bacterium]|nr:zf-HC2 domain-containing protein [Chthonomonadales bacterium]